MYMYYNFILCFIFKIKHETNNYFGKFNFYYNLFKIKIILEGIKPLCCLFYDMSYKNINEK